MYIDPEDKNEYEVLKLSIIMYLGIYPDLPKAYADEVRKITRQLEEYMFRARKILRKYPDDTEFALWYKKLKHFHKRALALLDILR